MPSIELIRASDGSGNANVATVQSSRSSGASTIVVDTVLGINAGGFAGTMGTPHTFTDPVTSETITVISEATAVDFTGHVDGSNLEIDDIADGYTDNGSEIGDIIVIRPTTQWGDNVADVLSVAHDDNGTLKDGAVDATGVLASNVVTTAKILDSNVTTAKILDSNVTTAKIAADAVTDAKLMYGKVRSRQGGSGTDWHASGTTTVDVSASNTFIQCGALQLLGSSVVTFPNAYTYIPIVVACVASAGSQNSWARISAITTTTFTAQLFINTTTGATSELMTWIAIGE